jgi:hypothetical protein
VSLASDLGSDPCPEALLGLELLDSITIDLDIECETMDFGIG